jgi:hypothetical protein
MIGLEEWFPNRQLEPKDTEHITALCGGAPVNNPEQLETFFRYSATPLIEGSPFKVLLILASNVSADVFDIDPVNGPRIFQNGALLYLGVLAEMSDFKTIPYEPKVFSNLANEDNQRFVWTTYERIHDEAPSFCAYMQFAALAIEATRPEALQVATVGAGLAHIMTVDSLSFQAEAAELDAAHPEFAEVDDIFNQVMTGE